MYQLKKAYLQFLLMLKKKFTKAPRQEKMNNIFVSGSRKSVIGQAASLDIKNKNDDLKKDVDRIAAKLVKKYYGDMNKTITLVESKKIKVYRLPNAVKLLQYIMESPGFIVPLKGYKAYFLNFVTGLLCEKKIIIKNETEAMFVFSMKEIDKFFFAAQVYKFVAFRKKMPGFSFEEQEKFKKIYKKPNPADFAKLTAGDIFAIKEVIARETEATDFALKLNDEEQQNTIKQNLIKSPQS